MNTEDYNRASGALQEIRTTDKAVITIILREDGDCYFSQVGSTNDIAELLNKYCNYMESAIKRATEGGKQ
ncbi:MAG: hypothetical protein UHS32_11230 [Bacteroidaceae bacterium]|nr:hypothetical protein [Bacteroidaceae bacterium]